MPRVTTTATGPVAHVHLTRADKRNALDIETFEAIVAAGEALMQARDIRAVVLSGDGPAFCAGLDTASFPALAEFNRKAGGLATRTHGTSNLFQKVAMIWTELPMPVIAAVHGFAFGGGFQIMLGADMRVAAPGTRFSVMEGKWGIVPDMAGMHLMRGLARHDVIRRLTYTAEIFDSAQALDWGFVTEIAEDPLARAMALAEDIATKSPDAIRAAKALLSETERMDPAGVLLRESEVQETLIGKPNQIEAVVAVLENRPPAFKD